MGKMALNKNISEIVRRTIFMLFGAMFVVYADEYFVKAIWLVLCLLNAIYLYKYIRYSDFEFSDGKIYFLNKESFFLRRKCIDVGKIVSVFEIKKKAGGYFKMIYLPSFVFVLSDDRKIEYFPALSRGKRLDEFLFLINEIPGLPPVSSNQEC